MKGEKILFDEDEFPTYRIQHESFTHYVEFKVFEVNGAYEGEETKWVIADEQPILNGSVKWDGCSNWDYLTNECMAHYCGVSGVKRFGDMQVHLYALAAQLMVELGTVYPAQNPEEFFVEQAK